MCELFVDDSSVSVDMLQDREIIEKKIVDVLIELDGELCGTYQSVSEINDADISDDVKHLLASDHFFYNASDRYVIK